MRRWLWKNTPIPEPHVGGLLFGWLLERLLPRPISRGRQRRMVPAVPALILGIGLAARSVREAGRVEMARPGRLVTSGPYALSRNPMYVAWSLIYLGLSGAINSWWPLRLLPAVLAATHAIVLVEERQLAARFGDGYRGYRARTPRYLGR